MNSLDDDLDDVCNAVKDDSALVRCFHRYSVVEVLVETAPPTTTCGSEGKAITPPYGEGRRLNCIRARVPIEHSSLAFGVFETSRRGSRHEPVICLVWYYRNT